MLNTKFRGKSLMPTVDLNYLNIEHDNGWVFGTYIDGYIINDVIEANDEYITIGNWVPVDNVGQYTGLKDKNGVEIFEGDILYFEPYETHGNDRVVQYINGAYHGRLIRSGYSKLLAECVYETKVIGNIYENSDLLEVSE